MPLSIKEQQSVGKQDWVGGRFQILEVAMARNWPKMSKRGDEMVCVCAIDGYDVVSTVPTNTITSERR